MRDISRRRRIFIAMVAGVAPVVEVVGIPEIIDLGIQPIGPLEGPALPAMQRVSLSVPCGFTSAFANADHGVFSILTRFYAVPPWLKDGERLIRSVDFKYIVVAVQMADANADRS